MTRRCSEAVLVAVGVLCVLDVDVFLALHAHKDGIPSVHPDNLTRRGADANMYLLLARVRTAHPHFLFNF